MAFILLFPASFARISIDGVDLQRDEPASGSFAAGPTRIRLEEAECNNPRRRVLLELPEGGARRVITERAAAGHEEAERGDRGDGHIMYAGDQLYAEWAGALDAQEVEQVKQQLARQGMRLVQRYAFSPALRIEWDEFSLHRFDANRSYIAAHIPQLRVQRNYIMRPASATPNDPRYAEQWSLARTGASTAWQSNSGDATVVIGIIDTGIDRNHLDFLHAGGDNFWRNPGEIAANGVDDDGNGLIDDLYGWNFVADTADVQDSRGHGTRMAGIIGAAGNNGIGISGVAQRVSLLPLRVDFSIEAVVQAIDYAIALRNSGIPIRVLSNSYGGHFPDWSHDGYAAPDASGNPVQLPLYAAVARANAAGLLFVAAAGNFAKSATDFFPAAFDLPNIVAVAATTASDQLWSSSNFHPERVDLGAPGHDILSTALGGSYSTISGTSEATAFTSGAAALLLAINPQLDAAALKSILLGSGQPLPALQQKTLSGRRIDLAAATAMAADFPQLHWTQPQSDQLQIDWPELLSVAISGGTPPYCVEFHRFGTHTSYTADELPDDPATFSTLHIADTTASSVWEVIAVDSTGRSLRSLQRRFQHRSPRDYWFHSRFPTSAPPADTAAWFAPDASGIAPVIQYFSPLPHPDSPQQAALVSCTTRHPSAPILRCHFLINPRATDVQWQVHVSPDLLNWTPANPVSVLFLPAPSAPQLQILALELDAALAQFFVRLQLQL